MDFAALITSARSCLAQFDYDHYPAALEKFEARATFFFDSLEGADLSAAAEAAIDALERGRKTLRRREQKTAAQEEKRVLALFFSPAALRRGGAAGEFADVLCRRWVARYPRNPYMVGTYEGIMKGFDANLLGLPLRKSKNTRRSE